MQSELITTFEYNSVMLGMRQSSEPIKGTFARDIRTQLWRISLDNKSNRRRPQSNLLDSVVKENRYQIVWKG